LIAPTKIEPIVAEDGDNLTYFKRLDRTFRNMKKEHGEKLREMFTEFTTHNAEEYNFQACHTSIMQKALKDLIQEIWGSIIPTNCPHCQAKSPGFRKDGATKIF
jgi:ribosomal protein S3AE